MSSPAIEEAICLHNMWERLQTNQYFVSAREFTQVRSPMFVKHVGNLLNTVMTCRATEPSTQVRSPTFAVPMAKRLDTRKVWRITGKFTQGRNLMHVRHVQKNSNRPATWESTRKSTQVRNRMFVRLVGKSSSRLREHMKIHTEEKSYTCKSFKLSDVVGPCLTESHFHSVILDIWLYGGMSMYWGWVKTGISF